MPIQLKDYIRAIPDYPKPGIIFQDLTPLLLNAKAFNTAIEGLIELSKNVDFNKIGMIDARGFLFGSALAYAIQKPCLPLRKANKLPCTTFKSTYKLEYGFDNLEMHTDAIEANDKILIVDDILATGGTLKAACHLVAQAQGKIAAIMVLIELTELQGAKNIKPNQLLSLIKL